MFFVSSNRSATMFHIKLRHYLVLRNGLPCYQSVLWKSSSAASSGSGNPKNSRWKKQPCMAIRRETINAWERRAPLSPKNVKRLTKAGVKVLVQPSNRRAYTMQDYIAAGAIQSEDISSASLIMSVKSVPIEELIPNKTYVFFSHTIKAQKDNMPLLDTILQKNIRLIDYEKMVDANGQRLVAFGKWAGYAGMINILHGLGLRLLALGHNTPFLHIGLAHNYRDSHMAQNAIRDAGYEIALGLMPQSLGPLTFVFTGSGNVSQGAQEIFYSLPNEYVDVANLSKVAQHGSLNKVYGCVVSREDHLIRKDGGGFDAEEYDKHPERYMSTFSKEIAPYTSVLINGIYWAPNSPRLMTLPDAKTLLTRSGRMRDIPGCPALPHRLIALCDISADPGGSVEFMTECTTIDRPFCIYDADEHISHDSFDLPTGVLVCSIDNMPAQVPLEATDYFGDLLLKFVWEMLESDATKSFEEFEASPVIKNAVIASNGRLTPNFEYISELRKKQQLASAHKVGKMPAGRRHKVLLLGAGFVSGPVVDYLCRNNDVDLTVVTAVQEEADRLLKLSPLVQPAILDVVRDASRLETLVDTNDLVISLLPYTMHPMIVKMCIKHNTNMMTASYLSNEMKALHKAAVDAGITVLNEVGLDPGIDHLLAMELIDAVTAQGGKVLSFVSWCGGLPSPEVSENPLRYKFSWSPRAVLLGVLNAAKYLIDGRIVDIPIGGALLNSTIPIDFLPGFNLEGYPNRDSTVYGPLYNISHAHTLLRGTLRYKGFSDAMKALLSLGLIDPQPHQSFDPDSGPETSWKQLLATLLNLKTDVFIGSLKSKVAEQLGGENTLQYKTIEQLGLFNDDQVVIKKRTPLDTLSNYLTKKLAFEPHERDLCLMRHDVKIQWPNNSEEIHHVELVAYGDPNGFSAMASTVGYTTAIAAKMILDGEIQTKGMVLPMSQNIYRPVLKRLAQEGIVSRSHRTIL